MGVVHINFKLTEIGKILGDSMKKYTLDSLEKLGYKKFIKIGLDLFSIILGVEGALFLKYVLK